MEIDPHSSKILQITTVKCSTILKNRKILKLIVINPNYTAGPLRI